MDFTHDVFLSHSSKDKPVVQKLAERLMKDGLLVWFDDWEIKPGDSILAKIEDGLERCRVLVLCMSANVSGSDWAQLEAGTFRFRDPLNKERRFIPLRLDDSPIKGSLSQFLYVDWRISDRENGYRRLLEACRPPAKPKISDSLVTSAQSAKKTISLRHKAIVRAYAFNSEGTLVITGATDNSVRVWNVATGECLRNLGGHTETVWSVAWSKDGQFAYSGDYGNNARCWDLKTGHCVQVFNGHSNPIQMVVWSNDGRHILTSSSDRAVRMWDPESGQCLLVLKGHTDNVRCAAWATKRHRVISGSEDNTIRVWDTVTGRCLRVLEGHTDAVTDLAWSDDQRLTLSGSTDKTVRMWDTEEGRCLRVFEGHTNTVTDLAWSADQCLALSGSLDKTVRIWDVRTGRCLRILRGHTSAILSVAWSVKHRHAYSGDSSGSIKVWDISEFMSRPRISRGTPKTMSVSLEQVQYTNAKVLLVGDSGVGKSGLSNYLAHRISVQEEKPIPSTDGAWATHWPLPHPRRTDGVDREIWLWDFAGQVDYRLVHQLFMDDTAAAVLVFNPQNENPFEGLGHWDSDLQKATRKPFAKLLTAGRIDRGGLVVSAASMEKFMAERGFLPPLHLTSAITGEGCDKLREAIVKAIDWMNIPETTSPALYHRMKQEILHLRDRGLVLIRMSELKQRIEMALLGEEFKLEELEAAVSLLAGPGMIQRLDFGGFILLQPEVLSRYAAAVVRKVRKHPQEMGCILESDLLAGELDYQDFKRLPREDEAVVLRTLLETFVSRAWCLRQPCDGTALLTFPSYFRRERKEQPSHPNVLVTYRFTGPTDDIYATLAVRLHYTLAFQSTEFWKSAADFRTQTGAALGFTLTRETEGTSRLEVYFAPDVEANSRVLFLRYVHDHLTQHTQNVVRLRHYTCSNKKCDAFNQPFADQVKIDKALAPGGKRKIFCSDCGRAIPLHDAIEERFNSTAVKVKVRELQLEGQAVIDNESRELLAVHHTGFIVAEAGQIYRGYTNSDHGIDGEIEFKDAQGHASGKRMYLQLKSGDSYLTERQRDGVEVFQIKNPRWAEYWKQHAYPVMLVIRTSDGDIRWMDVSAYLKRTSAAGKKVKQIVFDGERLDVMSVRNWRDKALA